MGGQGVSTFELAAVVVLVLLMSGVAEMLSAEMLVGLEWGLGPDERLQRHSASSSSISYSLLSAKEKKKSKKREQKVNNEYVQPKQVHAFTHR